VGSDDAQIVTPVAMKEWEKHAIAAAERALGGLICTSYFQSQRGATAPGRMSPKIVPFGVGELRNEGRPEDGTNGVDAQDNFLEIGKRYEKDGRGSTPALPGRSGCSRKNGRNLVDPDGEF